jgi:hypothetical protein
MCFKFLRLLYEYTRFIPTFRRKLTLCSRKLNLSQVLISVKEQRNILHEMPKRKANWIGHILRRNCLLQWVIEGKLQGGIEVTRRQGRRRRKLLDDLKESRGHSHLKEKALDHTMWRARFGRGFGPVVRQTTKWMNTEDGTRTFLYVSNNTTLCKNLKTVRSRGLAENRWWIGERERNTDSSGMKWRTGTRSKKPDSFCSLIRSSDSSSQKGHITSLLTAQTGRSERRRRALQGQRLELLVRQQ